METAIDEILESMSDLSAGSKDVLRQAFQLVQDEADMARARADEQEARADRAEIEAALWQSPLVRMDIPDLVHQTYTVEHFRDHFAVEGGRIVARDPKTGEVIMDGEKPASISDALRLFIAQHPNGDSMIRHAPAPMEKLHYRPEKKNSGRRRSTSSSSTGQAQHS